MKRILVVCPDASYDRHQLSAPQYAHRYHIFFPEYDPLIFRSIVRQKAHGLPPDLMPEQMVEALVQSYGESGIDGIIVSDDYPGTILASLLAQRLELRAPSLRSVVMSLHKYYSRCVQREVCSNAVPSFYYVPAGGVDACQKIELPAFVKPIKSELSFLARRVSTIQELVQATSDAYIEGSFFEPLAWGLRQCGIADNELYLEGSLVEDLLIGDQFTCEVAVQGSSIIPIGVVDSIMYPGTNSFARFVYPSQLDRRMQERMYASVQAVVTGLGFDNGLLNVEFMYDPVTDHLAIIEINPRMVAQFADLMEFVDGRNTYQHAIDIALGETAQVTPGAGKYTVAASCVLRTFQDARVISVPMEDDLAQLHRELPDAWVNICVTLGQRLSDSVQDMESYRYGVINLGARDAQELEEKFALCKRLLPFQFGLIS